MSVWCSRLNKSSCVPQKMHSPPRANAEHKEAKGISQVQVIGPKLKSTEQRRMWKCLSVCMRVVFPCISVSAPTSKENTLTLSISPSTCPERHNRGLKRQILITPELHLLLIGPSRNNHPYCRHHFPRSHQDPMQS